MTIKEDQKQARQCYAKKKLNMTPYPPTRELAKSHPIVAEGTQIMKIEEGSPIQALTICQASLDDEFDINPLNNTFDKRKTHRVTP